MKYLASRSTKGISKILTEQDLENYRENNNLRFSLKDKPQFKYTTLERAQILQGKPVANLKGNEAPRGNTKHLLDWATDLFVNQWGGKVTNPELGEIILSKSSVKDLMHHAKSVNKANSFIAVKDVIERGV